MCRLLEINKRFGNVFVELRNVDHGSIVRVNNMDCCPLHVSLQPKILRDHAEKTFSRIFRTPDENLILIDLNVTVEEVGKCQDWWLVELMVCRTEALVRGITEASTAGRKGL